MIEYQIGGKELFARVAPLWERLRDHHSAQSLHFGPEIAAANFHDRAAALREKSDGGDLFVCLARRANEDFGYVVASREGDRGEIDSLFVVPAGRRMGIGRELAARALAWLEAAHCGSIFVNVAYGNEEALAFYARFGIYPRSLNLYRKGN